MSKKLNVTTDQYNYTPGETAIFTAANVTLGGAVDFSVAHVNAGADGIYGTIDDLYTYDLTGTGTSWTVTDGGAGDEDGLLNGIVSTSWYVNNDALNQAFVVSATDIATHKTATQNFIDSVPADSTINLSQSVTTVTFGGAIWSNFNLGSGTGNIDPFVRIQANPTESGVNTSGDLENDEKSGINFTHDLTLAAVPITIVNGVAYREFRLDINENESAAGDQYLSLDEFKLFTSAVGNLSTTDGTAFHLGNTSVSVTNVFNLDAGGDHWVAMAAGLSTGSGTEDMAVLIPNSLFAGLSNDTFIYLWSVFGEQPTSAGFIWNSGATFEEWHVREPIAISGTKFNDLDTNGIKGTSEPGLAGWTIYIDANNNNTLDAGDFSTTTDASGNWSFPSLTPGVYVVREVQQSGWIQSAPSGGDQEFTVTLGNVSSTGNDFGNYQLATKTGTKFHDLNADGIRQSTEPGLAGWVIYDDANNNGTKDAGEASTATDASGNYTLSLKPGVHHIAEVGQSGWIQSYPDIPGDGDWDVTLTSGQLDSGNDFGNYHNATKTGTKFNDLNANGVKDSGEPGLAGWVIYDDANDNGTKDAGEASTATDASGNYTLSLKPGVHHIAEVGQSGWIQSFPTGDGDWDITLTSGELDSGNDFGNYANATKTGTKFNDLNADGVRQTGEPGLAGWVIYDDTNDNGTKDAGEASTATDASGNYTLSLKPGVHHIAEVGQSGWIQSFPTGDGDWDITLTSGELDSGNDFGNYANATKTGTKFNDLNADGVRQTGEPGLAGWVIYDDANDNGTKDAGEASTATDASGNYTLSLKPGVHHIAEVGQAGWIQSYPDKPGDGDWDVTLTSGQLDSGNDFGNYQAATKTGTKFNDLNANGVRDSGEPGLAGWVIYDDANSNGTKDAGEVSTATDASGNYTLTLTPGVHHITEVGQSGWIQSYPEIPGDGDWDITLTSGQLDSGNDFGNYQNATKTGTKFNDLNANGVKDSGEPGLAGWVIYDDANSNGTKDAGEVSTATDASGNYTLTLTPGVHHITEVGQSGWIQSYPEIPGDGDWDITLTSGQLDSGNDFGNYQNATKTGTKFNDLNANGVKDSGEPGIAGWVIYDDANSNGTKDAGEASTATDASGNYTLTLKPGVHHITEVGQSGWIQSYPEIPGDGDWDITLTSGQLDSGNDFGNYQNATKTGTKFNDLNANGVRDSGEPGIAGWGIFAEGIGGSTGTSTTTDASGNYTLTLKPGIYEITEEHRAGWIQSYPEIPGDGDWDITLTSGQLDSGNDFGNYQAATKTGTKFNDLNANGVRDSGEPGLAGWVIYDDANDNGTKDAGETSTATDASGNYTLSLKPGVHHIAEVGQSGWIQSYPEIPGDGDWDITLTSGQLDSGNDFGNYQNATKTGTKFNDLNANGVKDSGEPGIAGWVIYDDANSNGTKDAGEASTATDASGNYTLTLKPGVHHITEVGQSGWIQSYPEIPGDGDWDITLTSGQLDSGNDFGNYQNATKTGTKFNDLNANGVKDSGEPGLAGWVIYDDANDNGTKDAGEASTATDASGNYTLSLKPGVHHIAEVGQSGWIQSYPDKPGDGDWDVTLTSGQLDSGNDFGNYQNATKTGTKFEDLNGNGVKDSGDPGLSGWVIYDDTNDNGTKDAGEASTATDASGNYTLSLKPGVHHIAEVLQSGWIQSYPGGDGDWDITLTSGQLDSDNNFGNYLNGSIHGFKFNDLNGDGVYDPNTETPMGNITIQLIGDIDGSGTVDLDETITTTTDANGKFSFGDLHPGTYTITELFTDNGVTWGTTVDHNNDGIGDNTTQVTIQSGQELVAFQADIAGIPGPQHGVLADLNGYDLIFGNIEVGGCGLSPGFWANHLYVWDGIEGNGPVDKQGGLLADKLAAAGTIEEPDILSLFPTTADFPAGLNVDGNDRTAGGANLGPHNDLIIAGTGGQYLVIQWDDAQQLISGTAIKGGDKLADFTRMTINAFLDNIGVPGFNTPNGLLPSAADWLIANGPTTAYSGDSDYHILKYNNLTELNTAANPFLSQDGPQEGFATSSLIKASSTAWTGSGAAIFENLVQIICNDDPSGANNTGFTLTVSEDQSIVALGVCFDEWFGIQNATGNVPGGYNLL